MFVSILGAVFFLRPEAPNYSDALVANIEALSSGEQTPVHYKKSTGDCTIEAEAGATVELKLLGIKIASGKAGSDGSVTFKDVRVDCEIGGTFLCNPHDCADFYVDIVKAATDDDDEKKD